MKTKFFFFFFFIAMTIGVSYSFAQTYPKFDEDAYIENLKFSGQRPTIVDFVNNFLNEPEEELLGSLSQMWDNYKAGKAQLKGDKVTADTRNGFVKFERQSEDEDSKYLSVTEMCYWNCSDGLHKIVAMTNNLYVDGKFVDGQFTGTSFMLYENSTRRWMTISGEDIGAYFYPEIDYTSGFDGKDWYVERNGHKTIMTEEEYVRWTEDNVPVVIVHLPQKGKNIIVEYWTPKRSVTKVWAWDGLRFHKQ